MIDRLFTNKVDRAVHYVRSRDPSVVTRGKLVDYCRIKSADIVEFENALLARGIQAKKYLDGKTRYVY